jgi:organic hydroperoxide reductase OsmC/OhrA
MSQHKATIVWQHQQAPFIDNQYSRDHLWQFDGGVEVNASASPAVVPVPLANASCVDPEEAFVAALASCHMLWFLSIAAKQQFVVERYVDDAVGTMGKNADGRLAITTVHLSPKILFAQEQQPTALQISDMHIEAHRRCFLANSVKTEIIIANAPQ